MRSIFLRETDDGEWFLGVVTSPNVYLSVQVFRTPGQAIRAFIIEGRQQPFARMSVQLRRGDRPKVVREESSPVDMAANEVFILAAVKAALFMPHLRSPRVRKRPVGEAASTAQVTP